MRSGSRLISRAPAWSISAWLPLSRRVRAAPSVIASGHVYTSSEGPSTCTTANWWTRARAPWVGS